MTPNKNARRFAPAKINLYLHVGEKRPDGYHDLSSLIVFADVGDWLSLAPSSRLSIRFSGPFGQALSGEDDNLVLKAARALSEWAKARGHAAPTVEFALEKNLPVASGIGGGSSDAAAALHLLAAHWSLPIALDELQRVGVALGADVPVCLRAQPALVSGLGEILTPVHGLPAASFVLVNPRVEVSTAQMFKTMTLRTGAQGPPKLSPPPATARDLAMMLDRLTNDLSPPAKAIAPVIFQVETALVATDGCLIARMSGSGATCFGIYETQGAAQNAAAMIAQAHPQWWVKAAQSVL